YYPRWSPDGKRIAFGSDRDGNNEIYVMDADGTNQTRLTYNDVNDYSVSWSPDGSKIAYSSWLDDYDNVHVMNADGSGHAQLTTHTTRDSVPSWSPDGSRIAFRSNRDSNWEVYVMNANGTGQTRLTNNLASDNHPAWSPSGNSIAFTSSRDSNNEIYVMEADGSNQTRLTTDTASDNYATWSADGSQIVFRSLRDGDEEVYVMDADGSAQANVTHNDDHDTVPSWYSSRLPGLLWVGTSGYETDGCDPEEGQYPTTMFTFRAVYKDADSDWPTTAKIELERDGVPWRLKNLHRVSGSPGSGAVYSYRRRLAPGLWRYRFVASDGDGAATGAPTGWADGPSVIPRKRQFVDGLVWDGQKWKGENLYNRTAYKQRVNGSAAAGGSVDYAMRAQNDLNAPQKLEVRGPAAVGDASITYLLNGSTDITSQVSGGGWETPANVVAGGWVDVAARVTLAATPAQSQHALYVQVGRAAWGPSNWLQNHDVVKMVTSVDDGASTGTVRVTGLMAVPTSAGAHVQFALSSAAQVEARVLNIAGRPIKTICTASDC
ncbi:MAG TPA: DUF5050 domain-containing protein, partial [Armatimonadota bacterium]|nr:DUF5050 domain-containing protein [Armatimonadota bacterium]